MRRKLPDERHALTHKFDISGHEGYITVGSFEDLHAGRDLPGDGQGRLDHLGFADAFAQAISWRSSTACAQALVDKFSHVRLEPSGMTKNADVRFAKSIVDYIFRWMASKFLLRRRSSRRRQQPRRSARTAGAGGIAPKAAPATTAALSATGVIVPSPNQFAAIKNRRRAAVHDLRLDHGEKRRLLQVQQLRHDERLRVNGPAAISQQASKSL
jgi:ribonucleoside-diphosphate reductase alpha chain